jgi:uncharacterized membrane protein YeiH
MPDFTGLLSALDYAAVAVFGASGALAAARRKHDIITFGFFAAITGVGGGTLRDLLLGAPVFWVARPAYIIVCLVVATAVWIVGSGKRRELVLGWLDNLGLSAYAVVGALKALSFGAPPLTAVILGVMTATCGGIIRDVLAEEPSVLLRREIYVTAALAGAAAFTALYLLGLGAWLAGLSGFLIAFALRAGALVFGWRLPGFPGRMPEP